MCGVGEVLLRVPQGSPDGDTYCSSVQSAMLVDSLCQKEDLAAKQSTWSVAQCQEDGEHVPVTTASFDTQNAP